MAAKVTRTGTGVRSMKLPFTRLLPTINASLDTVGVVQDVHKENVAQIYSVLSAIGVAGFLITTQMATAGELVPYAPPVPRAVAPVSPAATVPQKVAVVVPESVYMDFEMRASKLTDQQRKQLVATFEQSRINASQLGDVWQLIHYQRLLEILGRKP